MILIVTLYYIRKYDRRVVYIDTDEYVVDLDDKLELYDSMNGKKFGFKLCPNCNEGTKHYVYKTEGECSSNIRRFVICLICGFKWDYTAD